MKRSHRGRPLAPEDVTEYKAIRTQAAEELPELIARHEERMAQGESELRNGWDHEVAREVIARPQDS